MDKKEFTAGEVKEITGMSYRQQHNWHAKKALSNTQESKGKWRKFSPKDLFTVLVCSEIRKQFGVDFKKIKYVSDFMFHEESNHFPYVVKLMALYGYHVFLLTDFKRTFIIDSDLTIMSAIEGGELHSIDSSYILLNINPIANKILGCLKEPLSFSPSEEFYELYRDVKTQERVKNIDELKMLKIMREKDYDRLTLHFNGGKMTLVKGEKQIKGTPEELRKFAENAVEHGEYEKIEIYKGKGSVLSFVNKTETIKPELVSVFVPARKGKE